MEQNTVATEVTTDDIAQDVEVLTVLDVFFKVVALKKEQEDARSAIIDIFERLYISEADGVLIIDQINVLTQNAAEQADAAAQLEALLFAEDDNEDDAEVGSDS